MKLKNILKTTGSLHILLGLLIIFLLIFSVETIAGNASSETLLLVRGTAKVVAASNLGIGLLLIICSTIKYCSPFIESAFNFKGKHGGD